MKKALMMLVLLCGMSTASVYAGFTSVAYDSMGPHESAQIWGDGVSGLNCYAGQLNLLVDNKPNTGFCVDLSQHASTTPSPYVLIPFNQVFSEAQTKYALELYAQHYKTDFTNREAAAFQIVLWEICFEKVQKNPKTYNVNKGEFYCKADAAKLANTWLNNLTPTETNISLTILHSDKYQDYVITEIPAVPDPASLLLVLSGLPLVLRRKP
jgi:hypothetical protein